MLRFENLLERPLGIVHAGFYGADFTLRDLGYPVVPTPFPAQPTARRVAIGRGVS